MEVRYGVTGKERKALVQAISEITETPAKYLGAPSMAYQIGRYQITKDGNLTGTDLDGIIEDLKEKGFIPEGTEETAEQIEETAEQPESDAEYPKDDTPEETDLTISVPRDSLPEDKLENLRNLIEAKADLIKQALSVEELPIETDDERITFPWFHGRIGADEAKAYTDLISKLTDMARTQLRVTAKPGEVENPRYAFRCFLLRLGFIGAEYKTDRKILLRNLSGSSAFKAGTRKGEE